MKRLAALAAAALTALPPALRAEEAEAPPAADVATLQDEARHLHADADAIRSAAEKQRVAAEKACWKKFLVQACLDEVGQQFRDELSKANALDSRARANEREIKRREVAARDARRAAKDAARNAGKAAP
jgi:colicin import membrane protein